MRTIFLFFCLAAIGCHSSSPINYDINFRDSQFDEDFFRLLGSKGVKAWNFAHRDPEGLRILLPESVDATMVGFATRGAISGDFEITIQYEIVQCGQPRRGFGVGPGIYLKTTSSDQCVAVLSRLKRTEEGDVYNAYRGLTRSDGTREHRPVLKSTNSTAGRFRLRRKDKVLSYLVSDAESENFRMIHRAKFDASDVSIVRFGIDRGGAKVPVEVVFKELSIRTGSHVRKQ